MVAAFVVTSYDDVHAVCTAAGENRAIELLTPPDAASVHGPAYWYAVERLAYQSFPHVSFRLILDCGGKAGLAMQAMDLGLRHIIYDGGMLSAPALSGMARHYGAELHTRPPHIHSFPAGLMSPRKLALAQSWLAAVDSFSYQAHPTENPHAY